MCIVRLTNIPMHLLYIVSLNANRFRQFPAASRRFMNGQPQPWSPDTSRLIIDTRAENQTIFVYHIGYSDAGNYTCVLRNATHKSEHRIELKVIGMSARAKTTN